MKIEKSFQNFSGKKGIVDTWYLGHGKMGSFGFRCIWGSEYRKILYNSYEGS